MLQNTFGLGSENVTRAYTKDAPMLCLFMLEGMISSLYFHERVMMPSPPNLLLT
jgi:hypothetical protein